MHARTLTTLLLASLGVLAACGGDESPAGPTTASSTVATSASATSPADDLFVSTTYRYTITSPAWRGLQASQAWDGTGSPGSADPTVDRLYADDNQNVYAYGGVTKASLDKFVSTSRSTGADLRGCRVKPEATTPITISGEAAVLDETHCNGVFALTAYLVSAGRAYVFFTFDRPGHEAATRRWFASLMRNVSLDG
jgi:hypothetical protein